ncbi:MAG: alpha/beta fold hydrolase [Phycisphaerae bacterium]|jgi:pimeloyl-ACP methyl ester carboxylesterase
MRFVALISLAAVVLALCATPVAAQAPVQTPDAAEQLPRRVWLGAVFDSRQLKIDDPTPPSLKISDVVAGGTAAQAGIRAGDVVLAINDTPVNQWTDIAPLLRLARTDQAGFVTVRRDDKPLRLAVTWVSTPLETVPGATVRYSSVQSPRGYALRTIIAAPNRPASDTRRLPAFLYVQGLGCATIDRPSMTGLPDVELPRELAAEGFVTLRVDKPGTGDSLGPPCDQITFAEELDDYRAAFDKLASLPEVDPSRVYIFGYSFGGVFAPFIAEGKDVAGIAVYGTHARTWLEYELENTRRQMTVLGESPATVSERLQHVGAFQSMLLLRKMTPAEIFAERPDLKFEAPLMDDTHQYGRHARFFHELQERNIAEAWQNLESLNVLALHGEYDWVSSPEDAELIARIATNGKGEGEMQSLPGLDHGMTRHNSLTESVTNFARGEWTSIVTNTLLNWTDRTYRPPARKPLPPEVKP